MKYFETKTGVGYMKDEMGRIRLKYDLPIGRHPISEMWTTHDVPDRLHLDMIQVENVLTPEQQERAVHYMTQYNQTLSELEEIRNTDMDIKTKIEKLTAIVERLAGV